MTTILNILQHALGRDAHGRQPHPRRDGSDYRNHFTTGEGGASFALCEQAVVDGLMVRHAPSALSGGDYVYTVTDAGRRYVEAHSPAPPRLTRSQRRYRAWLSSAAADCGVSFGEWLRHTTERQTDGERGTER